MVAAADLDEAAADRLRSSVDDIGVRRIEGPEHYSSRQVAAAFARALDRHVEIDVIPHDKLKEAFLALGFSDVSATSYARMTEAASEQGDDIPQDVWRGAVTLDAYIDALVASRQ